MAMIFPTWLSIAVQESSQVGVARRVVSDLVSDLGWGPTSVGAVALVVTELATNLVRHAGGGHLLAAPAAETDSAVDILALDRGPGMASVSRAVEDGYSTAGSMGTGLGAVKRASSRFELHSLPTLGSAVYVRVPAERHAARGNDSRSSASIAGLTVPKAGEAICGDAAAYRRHGGTLHAIVADGLGHGPYASEAARAAIHLFETMGDHTPSETVRAIHDHLRSTRGAAVAVASADMGAQTLRYCGVGNISAAVVTPERTHHLISHNGTVGHTAHKIQEFTYGWPPGATLVMHSDGLVSRWGLERYAGIIARSALLIAGVLYRDYARGTDDVGMLVASAGPNGV